MSAKPSELLAAALTAIAAWDDNDPEGSFGLLDVVGQAIGISIMFVSPQDAGLAVLLDGQEVARVAAFGHDHPDEWLFTVLRAVAARLSAYLAAPPPTPEFDRLIGDIAMELPSTMRQLHSLVHADGTLRLSLVTVEMPQPRPHEVVVRVQAAPVNPSDLGLLLASADLSTAVAGGTAQDPTLTAQIAPAVLAGLSARVGESLPVGNEGAGLVVSAGSSPEAQALLGRTVAVLGGATYAEYKCLPAGLCLALPDGTDPADGASCFVNPLTALSMVEVMRREGHHALVHTAAASNLGQMLVKICLADDVPLVNIVRSAEHEALLRGIGAVHVRNSTAPTFEQDLTAALITTGATLAFDAIGGGPLASKILSCMEAAANATATGYNRYGSSTHKQVYIYGGLDRGPTTVVRNFGMAWGISGWLLTPFLQQLGTDGLQRLRDRVVAELTTTFASHYTTEVSLTEALSVEVMTLCARQATGEKVLIRPTN